MLPKLYYLLTAKLPNGLNAKDVFSELYAMLSLLDAKANALLTVNSIFVATTIAIASYFNLKGMTLALATAAIALLALVASSVQCLRIVRMNWSCLELARQDGDTYDFTPEFESLAGLVSLRTTLYRSAWNMTVAGLSAFGLMCVRLALG